MKTTKKNQKSEVKNVYQIVTEKIVEQMEKGLIPWHKPWVFADHAEDIDLRTVAINYVTRRPYSMLNQMLLGFRAGEWMSYKQAKELGGSIKKGAESGLVVFWTQMSYVEKPKEGEQPTTEDNTGEETQGKVRTIPVLKYYRVYHLDDIEGIESKYGTDEEKPKVQTVDPIEAAEDLMWQYVLREEKLTFVCDKPSNKAYYRPSTDTVVVPQISQFKQVEEFYSTAFHELTHSTLPVYRCNRKAENDNAYFGNEDYSREELVAEMGSAMLCHIAGLNCERVFNNTVAYLQSWLRALKNDPKMIVWASTRAEKAAKYIQFGPEKKEEA